MKSKGLILILVVAVALGVFASAYVVDETEQVVVTQFGKVIGTPRMAPGLYFRIPFIQSVNYFPKNLLLWDGDPGQIPTREKTYIWVDCFARWKIVDPIKFFQTVNNTVSALGRLDDIIDPAIRNFITSYRLIETVRSSNRKLDTIEDGVDEADKQHLASYNISTGRSKIMAGVLKQAQPKVSQFGIELVDVQIKRLNYVEQVRKSVYDRMIAERNQIAQKFRSEGEGEARRILGEKERDLKRITSEAFRTAQEIEGKAEGEATQIYADAYGLDPEFYSFTKTLEIYGETMDKESSLILSTDSEFLKYFNGYTGKENNRADFAAPMGVIRLWQHTKKRHRLRHGDDAFSRLANPFSKQPLLALSSLVPGACKKLAVLVLPHFFSSFFNDTAQQITPNPLFYLTWCGCNK